MREVQIELHGEGRNYTQGRHRSVVPMIEHFMYLHGHRTKVLQLARHIVEAYCATFNANAVLYENEVPIHRYTVNKARELMNEKKEEIIVFSKKLYAIVWR